MIKLAFCLSLAMLTFSFQVFLSSVLTSVQTLQTSLRPTHVQNLNVGLIPLYSYRRNHLTPSERISARSTKASTYELDSKRRLILRWRRRKSYAVKCDGTLKKNGYYFITMVTVCQSRRQAARSGSLIEIIRSIYRSRFLISNHGWVLQ